MCCKKYDGYQVGTYSVNPFDRVMNALKSRGRKNAHILSILQLDWPASESIIHRLSDYISDSIKANEEPVIYPIIEEALLRYSQLVFHAQKYKYEDPARISAFLDTLITETCKALEVQIAANSGGGPGLSILAPHFRPGAPTTPVTFRSLPMLMRTNPLCVACCMTCLSVKA
ncbi:MAG: hypothetical protein ACRDC6_28670 [Shewanella sp.]